MFEPRTRRERVLIGACRALAKQINSDMIDLFTNVAIAQADEQEPPAPEIDLRIDYNYKAKEPA